MSDPEEVDARRQILGLMEDRALAALHEATRHYCARFPDSIWGWLVSVPTLVDLGLYEAAHGVWQKAQNLSSANADTELQATLAYWASVIFKEEGRFKRAQRQIEQALGLAPNEGSYWVTLGEICAKRGKRKAARKAYRQAIKHNATEVEEAHFNLALLSRAKRRYDDALAEVARALEIDPDYAEAHALRQDLERVLQSAY